ncbi:LytTR family DNA-binding domain-containing protein [Paraburkholderia bonniea]|uniref:LytR/AlgR family response regulator transcription factor n=1 Tax=Paraburkholderia bonniea TaxID=2152891 RepID=UPI001291DD46|nr:LytTR family DNA-binding domain-containing protein [Paraburkholderia bonniea]WJF91532.1 LytTR family DNA-binding domain-containing protein [Paraburkholderia bonniea]WJF94851.1 LytTR family DNA-binding domain-containing protein [Paraburkholderia bonniea]
MPTALIADDEPNLAIELASRLTQFWPELQIIAMPRNGIDALAELNAQQPDFAFLDIRMPGLDGLQIARSVPHMQIVFVTAYDEYAARAFDTSAIDYLMKPLTDERLLKCITRLQRGGRMPPSNQEAAMASAPRDDAPIRWLAVGYRDATRLVAIDEVIYFQATDKYTEVVTASHRHVIRTPLKELLPRLDAGQFVQVHRSVIVALAEIDRVERDLLGRSRIHLRARTETLPVSRGYVSLFRQM